MHGLTLLTDNEGVIWVDTQRMADILRTTAAKAGI